MVGETTWLSCTRPACVLGAFLPDSQNTWTTVFTKFKSCPFKTRRRGERRKNLPSECNILKVLLIGLLNRLLNTPVYATHLPTEQNLLVRNSHVWYDTTVRMVWGWFFSCATQKYWHWRKQSQVCPEKQVLLNTSNWGWVPPPPRDKLKMCYVKSHFPLRNKGFMVYFPGFYDRGCFLTLNILSLLLPYNFQLVTFPRSPCSWVWPQDHTPANRMYAEASCGSIQKPSGLFLPSAAMNTNVSLWGLGWEP